MHNDAKRCLKCNNAKCKEACPIHTDIPNIIKLYMENKLQEAGELLFDNNPFSYVCSLVCDHKRQCFGSCILNFKNEPIHFYEIEQEISKQYLFNHEFKPVAKINKRVAIIGGGPSGITCAINLALKGFDITIFEAHEKIGGVLRYGIPEVRLPKVIIDRYEEILKQLDVKIRPNITIGSVITIDTLLNDAYDAVYIATGVWNPKTLNIKGETLGNVHYAIDYLKSPSTFDVKDKKVIVIGAGNVAMDASRTCKSFGADVSIYYRKSFEEMPANYDEINDALAEGVKFELLNAPIEIKEHSMIFKKCQTVVDENGKKQTIILDNTEFEVECDMCIIAVSQSPRKNLVNSSKDLDCNKYGLIVTDQVGHTSKPYVYASGDVVTGAKTVVLAINNAKIVSETIAKEFERSV